MHRSANRVNDVLTDLQVFRKGSTGLELPDSRTQLTRTREQPMQDVELFRFPRLKITP